MQLVIAGAEHAIVSLRNVLEMDRYLWFFNRAVFKWVLCNDEVFTKTLFLLTGHQ